MPNDSGLEQQGQLTVPLRADVDLESVGAQMKAQEAAAKATKEAADAKAKIEAEEKLRREATAALPPDPRINALEEALRISEAARKRLADAQAPAPALAAPEPPKELSREELNDLYTKDPIAAIDYMQARALRTVEENVSRRLEPLLAGGASSAREIAMRKYPEEWKLFGTEIEEYVAKLPNKTVLNRPEAWDDLIAWMRGRPGNLEKMFAAREEQQRTRAAEEARQREAAAAGAHARSELRAPPPAGNGGGLDDTEREIAKTMGISLEEWIKWREIAR